MQMLERLKCLIFGHKWSPKTVFAPPYVKATLDTCDRCYKGGMDLAVAILEAEKFKEGQRNADA